MRTPRFARWLLLAAVGLLPLSAAALPVTYGLTSGTLTVTATLLPGTAILLDGSPSASVALTGTSLTFDVDLVPIVGTDNSISAFAFVTAASGPFALSPGVGGVTTISLSPLTVTGDTLFDSSASGTNPYNFTMNNILVTGTATTNLAGPTGFSIATPSASGSISVGTNVISVFGITIGVLPTTSGTLLLKGDFVFHGTEVSVPEPSAAALMVVGAFAVLAGLRRPI